MVYFTSDLFKPLMVILIVGIAVAGAIRVARRARFGPDRASRLSWHLFRDVIPHCIAMTVCAVFAWGGQTAVEYICPSVKCEGHDQQATCAFPDGSMVTVDANSSASARFCPFSRRMQVPGGDARLKVAKDPRPFVAHTPHGKVVAHGTIIGFRVTDKSSQVIVLSGLVETFAPAAPGTEPGLGPRILKSGESILLMPEGEVFQDGPSKAQALAHAHAWPSHAMRYRAKPLQHALDQLNNFYDIPARVGDAEVAAISLTGEFDVYRRDLLFEYLTSFCEVQVKETLNGELILFSTKRSSKNAERQPPCRTSV